jgi:hypothetical protein
MGPCRARNPKTTALLSISTAVSGVSSRARELFHCGFQFLIDFISYKLAIDLFAQSHIRARDCVEAYTEEWSE